MKLFVRIFLSFWIATLLMIGFVMFIGEVTPMAFSGDPERIFEPEGTTSAVSVVTNAYEAGGLHAFEAAVETQPQLHHKPIDLYDEHGSALVQQTGEVSFYASLANDILRDGHTKYVRLGFRNLYGIPIKSSSGRRYVAIMVISQPAYRFLNPRFWFNFTIAMFPAGIVCVLLALYLTRPITKLRTAARRLASGELDARAGPLRFERGDEIGDLARDFDAMAGQIELLMTAQRRFVADVSHELGAPLTRMHLAVALLRRQSSAGENSALLRIERETDKLSSLVQQLLLLAAMEAGRVPAEAFVSVSTRSLCESIIDDANFEAAHANCSVVGSRQDITFLAYPNLLRRAIDNVLRNAIRYAPQDTEIELNCRVDLIERNVVIDILDRGPGVPKAMLSDIFRPFFRTAPGREASSGGTGLGLAIAYEAVRLHDGTIEARNRPGGGLHVAITFPLVLPAADDGETGATVAQSLA